MGRLPQPQQPRPVPPSDQTPPPRERPALGAADSCRCAHGVIGTGWARGVDRLPNYHLSTRRSGSTESLLQGVMAGAHRALCDGAHDRIYDGGRTAARPLALPPRPPPAPRHQPCQPLARLPGVASSTVLPGASRQRRQRTRPGRLLPPDVALGPGPAGRESSPYTCPLTRPTLEDPRSWGTGLVSVQLQSEKIRGGGHIAPFA